MRAQKDENPGRADLGFQGEALTKRNPIVEHTSADVNNLTAKVSRVDHEPVLIQAAKALAMYLRGAL
jgi:hypothetical protein